MCLINTTPILGQRDDKWAKIRLGTNTEGMTIASHGCLLTIAAGMVGTTPDKLNAAMIAAKMFIGARFGTWAFYGSGNWPKKVRYIGQTNRYPKTDFPQADIARVLAHVKAGKPMFLEVDMVPYPRNSREDMHFVYPVAVFGAPGAEQIVVNDPWFADQVTVMPRYGSSNKMLVRGVFFEYLP